MIQIRRDEQFSEVFHDCCQRHQLNRSDTRFMYDGERMKDEDTPNHFSMEDEDVIDVCFV